MQARYEIRITSASPLLMHKDNMAFGEKVAAWRKDPANRELSVSGDDRSPAWSWLGYVYHNGKVLGIPSDNLMTMFREGGSKVKAGTGKETFKKQTQSGILIDGEQFDLLIGGKTIPVEPLNKLLGCNDFFQHVEAAEKLGFELLVKRAKIGAAKHVRVRPMFRTWEAVGSITVLDDEVSGLTQPMLRVILDQAGALCGLGDWRPSSPKASGTFGRFAAEVTRI